MDVIAFGKRCGQLPASGLLSRVRRHLDRLFLDLSFRFLFRNRLFNLVEQPAFDFLGRQLLARPAEQLSVPRRQLFLKPEHIQTQLFVVVLQLGIFSFIGVVFLY